MTVEKPTDLAHAWFINGTEQPIDVYVNYAEQPAITDQKGLELGTEYQVKGKDDTPYGTKVAPERRQDLSSRLGGYVNLRKLDPDRSLWNT